MSMAQNIKRECFSEKGPGVESLTSEFEGHVTKIWKVTVFRKSATKFR